MYINVSQAASQQLLRNINFKTQSINYQFQTLHQIPNTNRNIITTRPQTRTIPACPTPKTKMSQTSIYTQVSTHYGAAARDNSTLTGSYGTRVATEFGYSADDLANAPEESNLGLSCGNAVALAKLKEGETVVDLGSGAGFDVFQAVKKVGSTGKAVGVDMSEVWS